MPSPISALEHIPYDFVREVSPEAITFYVDELSGIYLPNEFKTANAGIYGVKSWRPKDRLEGKFGRFTLHCAEESTEEDPLDGILVMGTTIGLSGLNRDNYMMSLRHYTLNDKLRDILEERGLGQNVEANPADYGSTWIRLNESGIADKVRVSSNSYDFGRAKAEGRQATCEMFGRLLGNEIQIINDDPEPGAHERIVS